MEREIKTFAGSSLDKVVEQLIKARENGEEVFCKFNGHELHSKDVTMDSAYLQITGLTKSEFDKARQEEMERWEQRMAEDERQAKANIPKWIEQGKQLIFPERAKKWEKCVNIRAEDIYNGIDLEAAIEIMQALENGADMEQVSQMFDAQNHSGMSASIVRSIVLDFSKQGPEFYEKTNYGEMNPEMQKKLDQLKEENAMLSKLHSNDKTRELNNGLEQNR